MRMVVRRGFGIKIREALEEDDHFTLRGHAVVFDQVIDMGQFKEVVRRGAFLKTLQEGDQVALAAHDSGKTLARRSAGTLSLSENRHGVPFDMQLDPRISHQRDTFFGVQRGDLKGMSFGFEVVKDTLNSDTGLRELLEVRLIEISVVAFPAYETTDVEARSMEARFEAARRESESTREPGPATHSGAGEGVAWRVPLLRRRLELAELE